MEEQEWKEWMEEGAKPVTSQPGRALAAVQVVTDFPTSILTSIQIDFPYSQSNPLKIKSNLDIPMLHTLQWFPSHNKIKPLNDLQDSPWSPLPTRAPDLSCHLSCHTPLSLTLLQPWPPTCCSSNMPRTLPRQKLLLPLPEQFLPDSSMP